MEIKYPTCDECEFKRKECRKRPCPVERKRRTNAMIKDSLNNNAKYDHEKELGK